MESKLFDSELKVMEIVWQGDAPAREIAARLAEQVGWSKTTTYTVIKKCIEKGALTRLEPGFICHASVSRAATQQLETNALIKKLYDGAPDRLVAGILGSGRLSADQLADLRRLIDTLT